MEETQEKSLSRETVKIDISQKPVEFTDLDAEIRLAVECALEKKAVGLSILDLRQIASFTEFFVIASGGNQRQVQAIADEIKEELKAQLDSKLVRIEGYSTGEWVLLDYGDFIFHIFDKNSREFYDLERLWRDAGKVTLPVEAQ